MATIIELIDECEGSFLNLNLNVRLKHWQLIDPTMRKSQLGVITKLTMKPTFT